MPTCTGKPDTMLAMYEVAGKIDAVGAGAGGRTLFVLTLCLNVFALYIVRKYREQYD